MSKSDKLLLLINLPVAITFIVLLIFIFLYTISGIHFILNKFSPDVTLYDVVRFNSPDDKCYIDINQIGHDQYSKSVTVEVYAGAEGYGGETIKTSESEIVVYGRKYFLLEIDNNGADASPNNFSVRWYDDHARLYVITEEQPDCAYTIYYDDIFPQDKNK